METESQREIYRDRDIETETDRDREAETKERDDMQFRREVFRGMESWSWK